MTEPLTPQQIEEKLQEENAKELEQTVSEFINNEKKESSTIDKIGKIVQDFIPGKKIPIPRDSLELIFLKQKELSDYLSKSKPSNYYHHGPHRYPYEKIELCAKAARKELGELEDGIDWKWWKDYDPPTDIDLVSENQEAIEENSPLMEKMINAFDKSGPQAEFLTDDQRATQKQILENSRLEYIQKEIVDVFHFLVQMSIEAKLDPKKLVDMYLDKNAENHLRQDSGY